jgi:DNA topoisomerase-1
MVDCLGDTTNLTITAANCEFHATGTQITQPGWTLAWDYHKAEANNLPQVEVGQVLTLDHLSAQAHQTKAPARYTEGSLVKKMEELGIGRPSTYATIIQTILNRNYATKKGSALVPTWTAFSVVKLMLNNLQSLIDYKFTAQLETQLDEISEGNLSRSQFLKDFYWGEEGLKTLLENTQIDTQETNTIYVDDEKRYRVRVGPRAVSVEDTQGPKDEQGNFPRSFVPIDLPPGDLNVAKAQELIAEAKNKPSFKNLGKMPGTDYDITVQEGPYGPYVRIPTGKKKPEFKNAGLLKSMTLETLTHDQAVALLSLPRVLGTDDDGEEIQANNGRFGPYIKKGSDFRSIKDENLLFEITLPEAHAIFAQPKVYRRPRSKS